MRVHETDGYHDPQPNLLPVVKRYPQIEKQVLRALLRGATGKEIGEWKKVGGVWQPQGPIDLTAAAWGYATVASVAGAVVTVDASPTLGTSGTLRAWDVSAGASLGDVAYTRVGTAVTLTAGALASLAVGDVLYEVVGRRTGALDISATGEIRPAAGASVQPRAAGLYCAGANADLYFGQLPQSSMHTINAGVDIVVPSASGIPAGIAIVNSSGVHAGVAAALDASTGLITKVVAVNHDSTITVESTDNPVGGFEALHMSAYPRFAAGGQYMIFWSENATSPGMRNGSVYNAAVNYPASPDRVRLLSGASGSITLRTLQVQGQGI